MIKFLDLDTNPLVKEKYLTLFMRIQANSFDINSYALGLFTP